MIARSLEVDSDAVPAGVVDNRDPARLIQVYPVILVGAVVVPYRSVGAIIEKDCRMTCRNGCGM